MRPPIICGVDGSERTYEAVAVAWDIAGRLGLPLMLAHVVDEPRDFPFGQSDSMERERQERQAHGVALLRDVAMTFDLPSDTVLRCESGDPAPMLRALAAEEKAEMLVVASRGRGRIRSALFGSVTADMVDDLRCPMLVVPPGAGTRYRRAAEDHEATVACGIDGSTNVEEVAPRADDLAAALNARLLIIHADLPPVTPHAPTAGAGLAAAPFPLHEDVLRQENAARDQLERARELTPETNEVEVRAELGDLASAMAHIAEEPSVQLLAIARESPWQRLAAHAGCPVLVVPAATERARARAGGGGGEASA